MLTPEYTASATLTGVVGGELVVAPADTSLAVTLIPFMRGEKGDKGDKGDAAETDVFDYDQLVAATLL